MATQRLAVKQIITFLVLTTVFSSLAYRPILRVGVYNAADALPMFAIMWSPAAAALITRLVYQRNLRGIGWGWGKTRYQLWGYFIPIL